MVGGEGVEPLTVRSPGRSGPVFHVARRIHMRQTCELLRAVFRVSFAITRLGFQGRDSAAIWVESMRLLAALACTAVLATTGCAVHRTEFPQDTPSLRQPIVANRLALRMNGTGHDWQVFKTEWIEAFTTQASDHGMTFEQVVQGAAPNSSTGILLDVTVDDYQYVSPAARFLLGVATGNASFDAQVRFIDIGSGNQIGNKRYATSSSAWGGVFAPMTDRQVRAVAEQIMADMRISAGVEPGRPAQPMAIAVPAAVPVKAEPQGRDLFAAERVAKTQACTPEPSGKLSAKGPGFEVYTVACANGDVMSIRCEFGNCRSLR